MGPVCQSCPWLIRADMFIGRISFLWKAGYVRTRTSFIQFCNFITKPNACRIMGTLKKLELTTFRTNLEGIALSDIWEGPLNFNFFFLLKFLNNISKICDNAVLKNDSAVKPPNCTMNSCSEGQFSEPWGGEAPCALLAPCTFAPVHLRPHPAVFSLHYWYWFPAVNNYTT